MPKATPNAKKTGSTRGSKRSSSGARRGSKGAAGAKGGGKNGGKNGGKKAGGGVVTNYQTAVKFLGDRLNVEKTRAQRVDPSAFKPERMQRLMDALGNPERDLRCVHVAGTNGKGSVVAMLGACLRECGYTVGEYTSPHLTDVRERVQINRHMIPYAHFTEAMARVEEATGKLPKKLGEPTYFEVLTALALLYFAEQAVDLALIEVGMGGLLDSTNVIRPEVSAVTEVSLDHQQFLGGTLAEIAEQKAGIFKPEVPAVTFRQSKEALAAMRGVAERVGAPLAVVGEDIEFSYRFESSPQLGPHTRVGLSTERCVFEHVPVPLAGEHQAMNCGLVLAIVDRLVERGFEAPSASVIRGLAKTSLPGRLEMVWRSPRVVCDGAHNPSSLEALVRSIGAHIPYDSLVVIFGCASDKDIDGMLEQVARGGDKVIFTRAKGSSRAAPAEELARRFSEISPKMSQVADSLPEALRIAGRAAGRDDLVCVTGSFYLVGEAKKALSERGTRAAASAV